MTVTYEIPVRVDTNAFEIGFSSGVTKPVPFRVFLDRSLIKSWDSADGTGTVLINVGAGSSPFLEVLDKACSVPELAFPGNILIHWLAVTGAVSYRVEELVSGVWTLRNSLIDNGEPAFSWKSKWLTDITIHKFQISAIDAANNEGLAASYSILMVRHPDVPNVTYTYNGSGTPTVTIAAA